MKLGFICTNFNNSHFTVEAVRSLVASAGDAHEVCVVVVDNMSTAEHRVILKKLANEFPCVDLILNDVNVGYFPGLNCGIHHIRKNYPEIKYLIIGNNDLLFTSDFFEQMSSQHKLMDIHAVVSPDIVTLDGEHQNPHVVRSISKIREFIYDLYYSNYLIAQAILWGARFSKRITDRSDELSYQEAQFIYQGHGSCYFIGPKFFNYFKDLWAPTFLMGEEFFISKQLADKNLQVFYTPSVVITHCCHGSLQSIPSKKIWQFAKKAHLVYRKYVRIF